MKRPHVMVIGRSDACGLTGIETDLRAVGEAGAVGSAVLTAITVEGPGVLHLAPPVAPEEVRRQMRCLGERNVRAVKIGFMPDRGSIAAVAEGLAGWALTVVADPVLRTDSGSFHLGESDIQQYSDDILPLATVLTVDPVEAVELVGEEMGPQDCARALLEMGARWVILKSLPASDHLQDIISDGSTWFSIRSPRFRRPAAGSGALFASGIAARLALGEGVPRAAAWARRHVVEQHQRLERGGYTAGSLGEA
jgi:hydroxymethylpyrimidine/phosphomethylpyrimidine kinase